MTTDNTGYVAVVMIAREHRLRRVTHEMRNKSHVSWLNTSRQQRKRAM